MESQPKSVCASSEKGGKKNAGHSVSLTCGLPFFFCCPDWNLRHAKKFVLIESFGWRLFAYREDADWPFIQVFHLRERLVFFYAGVIQSITHPQKYINMFCRLINTNFIKVSKDEKTF